MSLQFRIVDALEDFGATRYFVPWTGPVAHFPGVWLRGFNV